MSKFLIEGGLEKIKCSPGKKEIQILLSKDQESDFLDITLERGF